MLSNLRKSFQNLFFIFLLNSAFANETSRNLICNGKEILGNIEKIQLEDEHITLSAKLDTGASMSSLCAKHIKIIKNKNQYGVNFSLCGKDVNKIISKPLYKFVKIRSRNEEQVNFIKRPVVFLKVRIGSQIQSIPINLTDRSQFNYPMLLGKDALIKFKVIVDPSR